VLSARRAARFRRGDRFSDLEYSPALYHVALAVGHRVTTVTR